MRTAGAWTPAERQNRAQQLVIEEILPRKQRLWPSAGDGVAERHQVAAATSRLSFNSANCRTA